MNNKFSLETKLTQLGRDTSRQSGFVNCPPYRGSTIVFPNAKSFRNRDMEFHYGTEGSPTIKHLEEAWTHLTGGAGTVLSPTGIGAITLAILTVAKAHDHILIPDSVYGCTREFCDDFLPKMLIEVEYYDPLIQEDIEQKFRANTTILFLESPGSQTFEVQNIPLLTELAHKHNITTMLDNTWATPIFFDAHKHGCDISIEAGTKYLSGHSDLMMGLISANDKWFRKLRETYKLFCMLPGAEDCFLALRGLRTLHIRLKEAEKRGLEIANWLKERSEVAKVLHPAFEDCKGHEFWKRDFTGSTGVFTIILQDHYEPQSIDKLLDHLSIFGMGFSWGGFESLITPFDCKRTRTATKWEEKGAALRLQIGLEDVEDLKNDLAAGFAQLY